MLVLVSPIAAFFAYKRGWGSLPWLLTVIVFVLGFMGASVAGSSTAHIIDVIDVVLILVLCYMAFVKKSSPLDSPIDPQNQSKRVKCPYCAELILPDAKICRYCNKDLS